jgi:hypothetical protein
MGKLYTLNTLQNRKELVQGVNVEVYSEIDSTVAIKGFMLRGVVPVTYSLNPDEAESHDEVASLARMEFASSEPEIMHGLLDCMTTLCVHEELGQIVYLLRSQFIPKLNEVVSSLGLGTLDPKDWVRIRAWDLRYSHYDRDALLKAYVASLGDK